MIDEICMSESLANTVNCIRRLETDTTEPITFTVGSLLLQLYYLLHLYDVSKEEHSEIIKRCSRLLASISSESEILYRKDDKTDEFVEFCETIDVYL